MKVYGIKNCNTVKKALDWLTAHHIPFEFHDYKKLGISGEKLAEWAGQIGWEPLLNRRGTTWKQLPPEVQASVTGPEAAFALMTEKNSVIKRPLIESESGLVLGFNEAEYAEALLAD
ncbi:MAG TPA: ArsC family reductase [Sphingobacteriaceae bacterium]